MKKLLLVSAIFVASPVLAQDSKDAAILACQLEAMSSARSAVAGSLGILDAEKSKTAGLPYITDQAAYQKLSNLQLQDANQAMLKKYCEAIVNGTSQ